MEPYQSQVFQGLVRGVKGEGKRFITESFHNESNYFVCPRVVKAEFSKSRQTWAKVGLKTIMSDRFIYYVSENV